MDYEDFIKQQNELNDLKTQNLALLGDKQTLYSTVETLLKVKCRRSNTLTIELYTCLCTYFEVIYKKANNKEDMKPGELLTWFITKLLRGVDNKETSCIVLDTNAIFYTEKALSQNTSIYIATTIENFSCIVQSFLKQNIINSKHEMNELFSECWITILNNEKFEMFMRKALNIYKQR